MNKPEIIDVERTTLENLRELNQQVANNVADGNHYQALYDIARIKTKLDWILDPPQDFVMEAEKPLVFRSETGGNAYWVVVIAAVARAIENSDRYTGNERSEYVSRANNAESYQEMLAISEEYVTFI